jgi:iron complex transport system ATP-binding protein
MSVETEPLLSCNAVRVSVPGRRLVDTLDLQLCRGEFIAILGPNGTGKTLTLQTLAGLRRPETGEVSLVADDIFSCRRQEVARQLALLPQVIEDIFPATVFDTALIGRHPHIGRLRWESAADRSIAAEALNTMELQTLARRDVLTLSGGERQRLAIAQILTQTPDIYLLDEPTNHLDPQHQIDAMGIFRRAADQGAAVIASLHDVNLAVRFADRCLLLFGDGRWQLGDASEVLNESGLSELFATPMEAVNWRQHRLFIASGSER